MEGRPPARRHRGRVTSKLVRARPKKQKTRSMSGLPMKRLTGLEPTTFCMASGGEGRDSQQECGIPPVADAVGLLPITVGSDAIGTPQRCGRLGHLVANRFEFLQVLAGDARREQSIGPAD